MQNPQIAQIFGQIAEILELKGVNPFRIRAYSRAAQSIENMSTQLKDIYDNDGLKGLRALQGIGEDLSLKIEELVTTGELAYIDEIKKDLPSGLFDIMGIQGMGPKKTKFVWEKFQVGSIEELKTLAESGQLEDLKGWGSKSVHNILEGIDLHGRMQGRVPIAIASGLAEEFVELLKASGKIDRIEIAGSLRRKKETIGDIDLLVVSKKPEEVIDLFCTAPSVEKVLAQGSTKGSIIVKEGIQLDLRVVEADVFGAALQYFTGSKEHNVRVRKLAVSKHITVSEYGVYQGTAENKGDLLASKEEEDVYAAIGLAWVTPELREDRGEVELAKTDELPTLIEESDIKGDLQMHSTFSDGDLSVADMAKAAKKQGRSYIAITDHASSMGMVKGVKDDNVDEYIKNIREAHKQVKDVHIFAGVEVDIQADGSLYLSNESLSKLDFVAAAIHSHFKQTKEEATARLLKAIEHPLVHMIAHPTARILGRREGVEFDIDAVLTAAKTHDVILELDAAPERLDLSDTLVKRAKEMGIKIAIDSDAHSANGLSLRYGVGQARRGWLTKEDVINTKSADNFKKWLQQKQ